MIKKIIFSLIVTLFIFSCGEKSEEKKETESLKVTDTASLEKKEQIKTNELRFGLELFTNREQIPFCVPLPLNNYKLNDEESDVKAKYVFESKKDTMCYFIIQGFFREDQLTLPAYFNKYYEFAEEEGKIIENSFKMELQNCFYVIGYYSNFPENKFLEVTWLRKDEVVRLEWFFEKEICNEIKSIAEYLSFQGSKCDE